MSAGIYSYLADITTEETRTFRIGVADGLDYISTMVGTTLAPQLFKLLGFYLVFGVSGAMSLCACSYVIWVVKESVAIRYTILCYSTWKYYFRLFLEAF